MDTESAEYPSDDPVFERYAMMKEDGTRLANCIEAVKTGWCDKMEGEIDSLFDPTKQQDKLQAVVTLAVCTIAVEICVVRIEVPVDKSVFKATTALLIARLLRQRGRRE